MSAPSTPSPSIPAPAAAQACSPQPRGSNASTSILRNNLGLPLAAGPDIMLSWEKDTFYAKQIHTQLKVRLSLASCMLMLSHSVSASPVSLCFYFLTSP